MFFLSFYRYGREERIRLIKYQLELEFVNEMGDEKLFSVKWMTRIYCSDYRLKL